MRLIDADALKERLQNLAYDDWNQGASTTWANAYDEVADMVDEQPTIEERKKGKWYTIENSGLAACECGYITDRYSVYNYCPACGADMRGKQYETN